VKAYRYGFNGKEKDQSGEFGGNTTYDYGFRIYNPAVGRFLSVDPLTKKYPWYTPYQFAGNKPVWAIDLDGLEEMLYFVDIEYKEGSTAFKKASVFREQKSESIRDGRAQAIYFEKDKNGNRIMTGFSMKFDIGSGIPTQSWARPYGDKYGGPSAIKTIVTTDKTKIDAAIKKRILDLADQTGYTPNQISNAVANTAGLLGEMISSKYTGIDAKGIKRVVGESLNYVSLALDVAEFYHSEKRAGDYVVLGINASFLALGPEAGFVAQAASAYWEEEIKLEVNKLFDQDRPEDYPDYINPDVYKDSDNKVERKENKNP